MEKTRYQKAIEVGDAAWREYEDSGYSPEKREAFRIAHGKKIMRHSEQLNAAKEQA